MPSTIESNNNVLAKTFVLSVFFVFLLYLWQGNVGFNLWDEGFLWYGAQRVMLGEVPIRDFMAYDPGRYYWSALLMSTIGDNGIMSLRVSVAVFQALGLFIGLLLIAQSTKSHGKSNYLFGIIVAVTLVVWMFPRHKLFDASLSLFLIGALAYLVQRPIPRNYLVAGFCIGLVATFGRNHGVYGVIGSLGAMLWLSIKRTSGPTFLKGLLLWAGGVTAGYSPVLLMALAVPGFALAFWESIRFLFEQKATNLPLPVPWPWTVNFTGLSFGDSVRGLLIGLFFIGVLMFGVLSILWVVLQRVKEKQVSPVLVASASLALPYAHFAFSRADLGHLAQGIFPLLVGGGALLSTQVDRLKWPLAITLCGASIWVMHVVHPGWQCLASSQCINVAVSGNTLQVDTGTANDIALLRQLVDQYAPNGQGFIATPFWPGAYPLLARRSPMWEIYALFPRSDAFERKEIERIKASKPGFAFVFDFPLDGREELRFRNTHPLIHQYILDNFDQVPSTPNSAYQIYKARSVGQ